MKQASVSFPRSVPNMGHLAQSIISHFGGGDWIISELAEAAIRPPVHFISKTNHELKTPAHGGESHVIRKGGVAFVSREVAFPIAIKGHRGADGDEPTILGEHDSGLD